MNEPTKQIHCEAKHTTYNPSLDEWKCPECQAPVGEFAIDEPAEGSSEDCERLHNKDYLHCYKCGYGVVGSKFATRIAKSKNLVPCPTCKGHGVVDGSKIK